MIDLGFERNTVTGLEAQSCGEGAGFKPMPSPAACHYTRGLRPGWRRRFSRT